MSGYGISQPESVFHSPTCGQLHMDEVFSIIVSYISEDPDKKYNVIIGSDSFLGRETLFISAIVVHRVGAGGRYFYRRHRRKQIGSLRHRIIYETTLSIELAGIVADRLQASGLSRQPVEIHIDAGADGDTREIIKEVVGMVNGCGYTAVTKPSSYGATKVADRHSK
jgi:hypothetical protein